MPRRPSKSKGASKSKARPVNHAEGKIKRWDKLSDIPMDEEDQCKSVLLHCNAVYYPCLHQSMHHAIKFCSREMNQVVKTTATEMKCLA
jgi:hypothetical protein